jgi:hypothetical protein
MLRSSRTGSNGAGESFSRQTASRRRNYLLFGVKMLCTRPESFPEPSSARTTA